MKLIQKGSTGNDVRKWQLFLTKEKYPCGEIDSKFGGRVQTATIKWQGDNGLIPDGIVGKNTIKKAEAKGFEKQKKYLRDVHEVILHITASNDNATIEDIRRGHLQRGFSDIGYHWVVDRKGVIHKGRDENIIGSHVAGLNVGTMGISYIARGKDTDPNGGYGKYMTPEQQAGIEKIVVEILKRYNLTIYDVSGHNNYNMGKACPCFNAKKSDTLIKNLEQLFLK